MTRISLKYWIHAALFKHVIANLVRPPKVSFNKRDLAPIQMIPVETRHGVVRCFVRRPHPLAPLATSHKRPPVHIHVHGGGFIVERSDLENFFGDYVAGEVGAVSIAVEYATAPSVQYPVAEEQVYDVLQWVAKSGDVMGWDSSRIGISGGSAGGKLALSALQLSYRNSGPKVRACVLFVPCVDLTTPESDLTSALAKPMINANIMRLVKGTYFANVERRSEPLASPALDMELAKALPPTLIISGEYDTLTPSIERLNDRLVSEGVDVAYLKLSGLDHASIASKNSPPNVLEHAYKTISMHLTKHLSVNAATRTQ